MDDEFQKFLFLHNVKKKQPERQLRMKGYLGAWQTPAVLLKSTAPVPLQV